MAFVTGQCQDTFALLDAIVNAVALDGWTIVRSANYTYKGVSTLGMVVLNGVGDGNDNIHVTIGVNPADYTELILDASAGADSQLEVWEQPGSIQQWNRVEEEVNGSINYETKRIPSLSLVQDERFYYFIFSNTYRIVVVCRLSTDYESAYLGFLNPISSERQYPYPMYVAGNNTVDHAKWPNCLTNSFVFPTQGTGWLRRADGVWRLFEAPMPSPSYLSQGALFPYDTLNTSLVPNYREEQGNEFDFILIPILLHTNDPVDMNGALMDVFWISGARDIASEQIVVIGGVEYMVFDSGMRRTSNSYFVVKIEQVTP